MDLGQSIDLKTSLYVRFLHRAESLFFHRYCLVHCDETVIAID